MGNRKEQIENLENEIAQKQQTLRELKMADLRNDPDNDLGSKDQQALNEIIDNLNI